MTINKTKRHQCKQSLLHVYSWKDNREIWETEKQELHTTLHLFEDTALNVHIGKDNYSKRLLAHTLLFSPSLKIDIELHELKQFKK